MIQRWCGICNELTEQTWMGADKRWSCDVCKTVTEDSLGCKLSFVVKGTPQPKGRPRATIQGGFAKIYTPASTAKYEQFVKMVAVEYAPPLLLTGPLVITLHIKLQRPASLPAKIIYCKTRPDVDNSAKSILDALESVIYKNDSQIVELHLFKQYGVPGVQIEIEELKDL